MIFHINEINPQKRFIQKAASVLKQGGLVIYPTDTVYAYACGLNFKNTIEKIYRLKKIKKQKPLSFIFSNLSQMDKYIHNMPNPAFKIMKKVLPGPYTFIFKASKIVPRLLLTNQKTIGVRIPDNNVVLELLAEYNDPLISASVNTLSGEYIIDPTKLEKMYQNEVDLILDAGIKKSEPSTIIDFSNGEVNVVREGKGEIFF